MEGFLNPQEVLKHLNLREDMIIADFGSGSGGWTIPLAKEVKKGRVFAIDLLEEPLSALKSRAKLEGITNIETVLSNLENKNGSKMAGKTCDLVLLTNFLFQIKDREKAIAEAKRILKKGGKMLIIDWKKDSSVGPKERRISSKEVKEIADNLDLELEQEFSAGVFHFALIFTKV